MNLFRGRPAYPKDRDLARVVQAAASRLAEKLERVDPDSLDLSSETRGLFRERRMSIKGRVEHCAHIFAWALPRDEKPFSDLSLVAFNDGLGFFSLLAKECSVGTVVYHGTDDDLRRDARIIAKAIGNPVDHYVFGDLEDLEFVMERHSIPCDVFVSCDALEHVDKLETFFDAVSGTTNGAISFGLGLEKPTSPSSVTNPVRDPGAARVLRCFNELSAAGFQVNVIRGSSSGPLRMLPRRVVGLIDRVVFHPLGRASSAPSDTSLVIRGSRTARPRIPGQKQPIVPSSADSVEPLEILVG